MAARGGGRLHLQLRKKKIGDSFSKEFIDLGSNIELGLGWLRAVAQGYSYSYNKLS